jgi:hypothetical protein
VTYCRLTVKALLEVDSDVANCRWTVMSRTFYRGTVMSVLQVDSNVTYVLETDSRVC